ncbi:MAG: hypothetical protein FWB98_01545 [Defluviitaleaceae bacterium]|nr:hypothetical protein [Defluviitaleaceae bacterium]
MKKSTKRLIVIVLAVVGFVAAFFFFFAPGWMLGGINYITPESNVRITQFLHVRTPLGSESFFDFETIGRTEYQLSPEQVAELSSLMRNSWYRRTFRQIYRVPEEVTQYYQHIVWIELDNHGDFIHISFNSRGLVLRYGRYGDYLRMHNANWLNEMLRILAKTNGGT